MEIQLAHSRRHLAYFHGLTMRPLLQEGDEVETEPITWAQVRVGDVVTYRFEDKFPTRRVMVIDRPRRQFVIMGDSIPGRRQYLVAFDDVIARVRRRRRAGEWLEATSLSWRARTAWRVLRDRVWRARWLAPARRTWGVIRRTIGAS